MKSLAALLCCLWALTLGCSRGSSSADEQDPEPGTGAGGGGAAAGGTGLELAAETALAIHASARL